MTNLKGLEILKTKGLKKDELSNDNEIRIGSGLYQRTLMSSSMLSLSK